MAHEPQALRDRREEQRAAVRRRRATAIGALAALVVLVVAVVAFAGGGSRGGGGAAKAPAATTGAPSTAESRTDTGAAGVVDTSAERLGSGRLAPDAPVPILMYHVIGDPPSDAPYPDLYVSREDFAGQMASLKQKGYVAVTQQEVYDAWHQGGRLPAKPVVVSFDDGYAGIYKRALPAMRRLGWPGVVNLELKVLGQPEEGGLSPQQVKGLIRAGWEINSHTINHTDLTTVDAATLRSELVDSRAEIKRRFGVPANFFCYPAGKFNDAVVAAVDAAGYLGATTVEYGLARKDVPFTLSRIRINGSDGVGGFDTKIDGAAA